MSGTDALSHQHLHPGDRGTVDTRPVQVLNDFTSRVTAVELHRLEIQDGVWRVVDLQIAAKTISTSHTSE